jgi:AraC-like DNA-binding protein
MPSTTALSRSLSDVDEFRAFARPVGAEYLVTGKGRFSATVTKLELENVWAQCLSESRPRSWCQVYTQPRIGIFFQAAPAGVITYAGRELGENDIGFSRPGWDHWQRISGESQLAGFSLPQEFIAQQSSHLFGRDLTPCSDRVIATLPPPMMERLKRLHARLIKLANASPKLIAEPHVTKRLDAQLTEIFLECLDSGSSETVHPGKRQQSSIVKRLYELGVERPDEPLCVMNACMILGVSARMLHRTCCEQLGMGPKRYLILRRFHMAHRALRSASLETSVTDIATRFGFWELGRFAVAYKTLFGESPSATLRNRAEFGRRNSGPRTLARLVDPRRR